MAGHHWINGTIGVRFARGCHPDDLWKTYFTSSKVVQEYRKEYGEPDVIQIRQTFNDSLQAREWEEKVQRRMNCVRSPRWLNRCRAGKKFYCLGHNEETRQKKSDSLKGTVVCLDIITGIKARIPTELYQSDKTRYFHNKSKVFKEWRKNNPKI